jgi:hypothetical protein
MPSSLSKDKVPQQGKCIFFQICVTFSRKTIWSPPLMLQDFGKISWMFFRTNILVKDHQIDWCVIRLRMTKILSYLPNNWLYICLNKKITCLMSSNTSKRTAIRAIRFMSNVQINSCVLGLFGQLMVQRSHRTDIRQERSYADHFRTPNFSLITICYSNVQLFLMSLSVHC